MQAYSYHCGVNMNDITKTPVIDRQIDICMHARTHARMQHAHMHTHAHTRKHTHTHTHAHTHTHTRTHTHMHTHTHTHTHTQREQLPQPYVICMLRVNENGIEVQALLHYYLCAYKGNSWLA